MSLLSALCKSFFSHPVAGLKYRDFSGHKPGVSAILYSWGYNSFGQLGQGAFSSSDYPLPVKNLEGVVNAAAGSLHSLAVTEYGTVWAWGCNRWGQLGNAIGNSSCIPVQLGQLNDIIAVAGGFSHSLALKGDGSVWAWGANLHGQRGDGFRAGSSLPAQVKGLNDIMAISSHGGNHNLALRSDGTVWAWGQNNYGQLGNYRNINSEIPVQVAGLEKIRAIACGVGHSMALKADGTLWAWGWNNWGQIGNNCRINSNFPVQVNGINGEITAAAGGINHSLALQSDGIVWTWGRRSKDQYNETCIYPVQISSLTDITGIAAGIDFNLALKPDGTVLLWNTGTQCREATIINCCNKGVPGNCISLYCGGMHCLAIVQHRQG